MNVKFLAPALAAISAAFMATPAHANFADFCVDVSAYHSSTANTNLVSGVNGCTGANGGPGDDQSAKNGFKADLLQGGYQEKLQLDGLGGFAATIVADWGRFKLDDLTSFSANSTGLGVSYNLYAVIVAAGSVNMAGTIFTPMSGTVRLYLDTDIDTAAETDRGLTGIGNDLSFSVNDDILLATGLYESGTGNLNTTGQQFDIGFDTFTLTVAGQSFFISPRPFFLNVFSDGDITGGTLVPVGPAGLFSASGELSAVFSNRVPEPGTLALAGFALLGLAAARRRKA